MFTFCVHVNSWLRISNQLRLRSYWRFSFKLMQPIVALWSNETDEKGQNNEPLNMLNSYYNCWMATLTQWNSSDFLQHSKLSASLCVSACLFPALSCNVSRRSSQSSLHKPRKGSSLKCRVVSLPSSSRGRKTKHVIWQTSETIMAPKRLKSETAPKWK